MAAVALALVALAAPASAQVTPAAGYTPPDDTPSIKVGATIFMDYTVQQNPKIKDADGNEVTGSAFNVSRSYVTVTGKISHLVEFRVTSDIARETGAGSSLNGSYTFRLKYAFAQFNLDDWLTKGSWARFGQQQTPYIDYMEGVYRYRFQGPIFVDREGFLTSSDLGASFHYNLAQNYGEIHTGVYNGEGYGKTADPNNEKAFQIRGTLRPFAHADPNLRGLRVTGFYDADHYVKGADKRRALFDTTFEHKYVVAGYDYLDATDQTSVTKTAVDAKGWTFWATPRAPLASHPGASLEALFRYDQLTPDKSLPDQKRKREIIGLAYWFPHQGSVSSAIMLDYDNTTFDNFTSSQPTQRKVAVHGLINF